MLESLKNSGKRWPRGQKFGLTPAGIAIETAYRAAVASARASGRNALTEAEATWAAQAGVKASDGIVLGELRSGKRSIADLVRAFEDCGTSTADVKAAIDRLTDARLVEAIAVAPSSAIEAA